jgi:hypothetical protein
MRTFIIIAVIIVIIVAGFYLWLMQEAGDAAQEESGASLQGAVVLPQPEKYIPPGAVMEDGTI